MKVGIYYFSGTGNTRWLAEQMNSILLQQGHSVEMASIEEKILIEHKDLIIIGGPIYAGNVPEMLIRWVIRNVPKSSGSNAIVFSSSAGIENANGVYSIGKKLQKKGYELMGLFKYILPRNYYLDGYEKTSNEISKKLFKEAEVQVKSDIISLSDTIDISENVFVKDMIAELMSVMTRFMAKNFSASEACIGCKKCEVNCPTKNIEVTESVKFKSRCMMCTRCIHNCPVNAIMYKGKIVEQYSICDVVNNLSAT